MSMRDAESYPFTAVDPALGEASLQPHVPVTLTHQGRSITVSALLDTDRRSMCYRTTSVSIWAQTGSGRPLPSA